MILDPKKKGASLATPRYVPAQFKPLTLSPAMQEAARRSERQPKIKSLHSKAEFNRVEGK